MRKRTVLYTVISLIVAGTVLPGSGTTCQSDVCLYCSCDHSRSSPPVSSDPESESDLKPGMPLSGARVEVLMPCVFEYPEDLIAEIQDLEANDSVLRGEAGPRFAILEKYKWPKGSRIICRFIDGTASQQNTVKNYIKQWEQPTGLRFDFVKEGWSHIRIDVADNAGGGWSYLGTACTSVAQTEPTMQLGMKPGTAEEHLRRVVLHEFGHALGLIHEHQSPEMKKVLIPAKVREYFRSCCDWTDDMTQRNVLDRVSDAKSQRFDINSIMGYSIPYYCFEDQIGIPYNTWLSEDDKEFAKRLYSQ
jgi:serralysin